MVDIIHLVGNIDNEESVILYSVIKRMLTRWTTLTMSHDKYIHPSCGILNYVNNVSMQESDILNHITCNCHTLDRTSLLSLFSDVLLLF